MSDAAPERYHYRDPLIDDVVSSTEEGHAHCIRCGDASLDPEELRAHELICREPLPDPVQFNREEGLPTLRRPNDIAAREQPDVERPLWRRVVRRLRVLTQPSFRRCETCPSFHDRPSAILADHVADLYVVERDGAATLIPHREIKQWEGRVIGPLALVGWCSSHDRGVFPEDVCERWRP